MDNVSCPYCNKPLSDSIYLFNGQDLLKSCPKCSEHEGKHVFHPCPNQFGFRTMNNHKIIQSYCYKCRSNSKVINTTGISCEKASSTHYCIDAICLIPATYSELNPGEDFELLFKSILLSNSFKLYSNIEIKNPQNTLILLHDHSEVRGFAVINDEIKSEQGFMNKNKHFQRCYSLYPNSIHLFKIPITYTQMTAIDPSIKSFEQKTQKIDIGTLASILELNFDTEFEYIESAVIPEELPENTATPYTEGAVRVISVNAYERNHVARAACIRHYTRPDGSIQCQICGFDFGKVYGEEFKGMITVHHLVPISTIKEEYVLDPVKDLIPICNNCHTVVHKNNPPYTVEEVKKLLEH